MSSALENSFFMRKVPLLRLRRSLNQLCVQKVVALFENIGEFFLNIVNDGEQTFRLFDDELFENRIIYGAQRYADQSDDDACRHRRGAARKHAKAHASAEHQGGDTPENTGKYARVNSEGDPPLAVY